MNRHLSLKQKDINSVSVLHSIMKMGICSTGVPFKQLYITKDMYNALRRLQLIKSPDIIHLKDRTVAVWYRNVLLHYVNTPFNRTTYFDIP